jgi:MFS family permease
VTFTDSKERAKAFGVYGALSGVGAAIGLIAGGLLTQYFSWRWCLFVNTPMAIIAFSLAIPNIHESKVEGHPHYDVPGALTATVGMVSIVYGVSQASTDGWGSTKAWPFIIAGAVLLFVFFLIETRVKSPLLPMRLILDRVRGGAFLSQILVGLGLFGMFLFMTFYFQNVHEYSAVKSGLLFLPFSIGIILSAGATSQLLPKIGPRILATTGFFMGAIGMLFLSFIKPDSSYLTHVMPAMVVTSLGLGIGFVSVASSALFNVHPEDTGAASAVLNTAQQIGGSFGTAIQNTIVVSSATAYVAANMHHNSSSMVLKGLHNAANVHGYDLAFRFGSAMLLLAALAFFFLVNIDRHHLAQHDEIIPAI